MKNQPLSIHFENPNTEKDTVRFLIHLCAKLAQNRENGRPPQGGGPAGTQ